MCALYINNLLLKKMVVIIIFVCKDCPYGKDDFKRRMNWYNKIVAERGILNDVYYYLKPEDAAEEFEQFLNCDKVGGKVFWAGRCEDAYTEPVISQNRSKQKKRNKRERDQKYKNHLKFLAENIQYYPSPAIYVDEIWVKGQGYIKNPKPYYKRLYHDNHSRGKGLYKYYKKYSNRCVRRYKKEIHSGGAYKKIFDYWWTVD